MRVDDAKRAVDAGVSAISVSNHGGNNLDGTPASIRALPAIADAVGDQVEVLLDGGIRRGSDVVKALALGARAVMIGRAYLWGLAAEGQAGCRERARHHARRHRLGAAGPRQGIDPRPGCRRRPDAARLHPCARRARGRRRLTSGDGSVRSRWGGRADETDVADAVAPAAESGGNRIGAHTPTIGAHQVNSAYHRRVAFPSELGNSTTRQLRDLSPALIIPLGSTEQHGPHLPLDTDTRIATAVADAVAERLAGDWMLAPAISYGASGEHEGFPGTVSIGTYCAAAFAGRVRQVGVQLGVSPGLRQRPRRQRRSRCCGHGSAARRGPRRRVVPVQRSGCRRARRPHRNVCIATYFAGGRPHGGMGHRQPGAARRADAAAARRRRRGGQPGRGAGGPDHRVGRRRGAYLCRDGRRVLPPDRQRGLPAAGGCCSDGAATARRIRRAGGPAGQGAGRGLGASRRVAHPAAATGACRADDAHRRSARGPRRAERAAGAHPARRDRRASAPASGPSHRDVTVVIPVRDNAIGLNRLVQALRGMRVVVVDDGSARPVEAGDFDGRALRRPGAAPRHEQRARRRAQHRAGRLRHRLRRVPRLRRGPAPGLAGGAARALLRPRRRPGGAPHRRPARAGESGGALRGGAVLARPRSAGGAGGSLRHGVLRAERGHHLPAHGARPRWAGSTRP